MDKRRGILRLILICLVQLICSSMLSSTARQVYSMQDPPATPTRAPLTPMELITMINRSRTGRGLPALTVDSILMGTAQTTADIMAAYHMTSHIGDVRGRVMAAGYGVGDIPWATENFAVMQVGDDPNILWMAWADELHMKPMADPNYRHIGAGVAVTTDGDLYYIVHAAYTSNKIYHPNSTPAPGTPVAQVISQYIYAVQTAAPAADGSLVHVVRNGQSMWSIAIAYGVHIKDLQRMNGYLEDQYTIWEGQKLRIPARMVTPTVEASSTVVKEVAVERSLTPVPTVTIQPDRLQTTEAPIIPSTGPDKEQVITTTLIVMAVVGAALTLFGILVKTSR